MSISKAKPALVLAAIAAIVSALVIITYNVTYVDTSGILTDKQAAAAVSIYGGSAQDYSVVPADSWQPLFGEDKELSRVTKVIRKNDGSLAIEVVVKGYKEGYDILVGVSGGEVTGVAVVSTGEETKDLGTKTAQPEYLRRFKGISGKATIVKSEPKNAGEVQAVTGATYSSKGVASAVNIALSAYEKISVGTPDGEAEGKDG